MTILPTRNDLGKLLPEGSVGAEIGVHRGYFSVEILKWKIGKVYLVDAWVNQGQAYVDPLSNDDHEKNLEETERNVSGHMPGGRVAIVRGMSLEVAASDRVPLLDWFYLDADHSYMAVYNDLVAWSKKLKPAGVIMGHDYCFNEAAKAWGFGVIPAVYDFCIDYGWLLTHLTDEDFASFVLQRKL